MNSHQKILLISTLIGIMILLFISANISPQKINILSITNKTIDQRVQIEGNIIKTRSYTNNTFHVLTINDSTGEITAIFNSKRELQLNINYSQDYILTGRVTKYNETLQINADKIILKGI